ncbi:MAG: Na/Pi cotransporter family protein [bacterium]|jgi:phosphate:Na+ symporter
MVSATLFGIIGGLGLFLFGLNIMAEGLQKAAGEKMRRFLEILTSIPIVAVLMGALVTAVVQSSSATTVMVVGFVNAGLMNLKQAVGVIMGANIGTTITAQLVAFHLTDYALPAIGMGFALYYFTARKILKYIGQALLGFGILFLGMGTMSVALNPLREYPPFLEIMIAFGQHPILGILVGALFTALIQSSSATTSLVIVLAGQNMIDISGAIALVFGSNIGTTVTALIASIGTSLTARRTAVAHLFFNVGGVIIFLPFFGYFIDIMQLSTLSLPRMIANAHTAFNVINTILLLPFINSFVSFVTRVVPGEEKGIERGLKYIEQKAILRIPPAIAISQATKEIVRMAKIAEDSIHDVMQGFLQHDLHHLDLVLQKEEVIDELEREITFYLVKLSQRSMTEAESQRVTGLLHALNDIERIGDHAENISNLVRTTVTERLPVSTIASAELQTMFNLVADMFQTAYLAVEKSDQELARKVLAHEDEIDLMERTYRNNHIRRLNEGICFPASGVVYLDIISNLERIGDHATNIAHIVMGDWR